MAKILEVGRSKTQDTPPDHGTNTEYDPLLEGQPVEYIKHVGRNVSSSRNAAYEARGSADNALEAAQTHSRETNVECGAAVKPRCDKSVDKSSRSRICCRNRPNLISNALKCVGGWGSAPYPTGELTTLPQTPKS